MISLAGLSIGELAAFVADHLNSKGIDVVLVGGACISIYSENKYSSFDLDFIATGMTSRLLKSPPFAIQPDCFIFFLQRTVSRIDSLHTIIGKINKAWCRQFWLPAITKLIWTRYNVGQLMRVLPKFSIPYVRG